MNRFDCHTQFATREDGGHSLLPPDCDLETAPIFCTALCSLSGWLPDATTQQDLDEAFEHGWKMLAGDEINEYDLQCETDEVLREVNLWGQHAEMKLKNANPC